MALTRSKLTTLNQQEEMVNFLTLLPSKHLLVQPQQKKHQKKNFEKIHEILCFGRMADLALLTMKSALLVAAQDQAYNTLSIQKGVYHRTISDGCWFCGEVISDKEPHH